MRREEEQGELPFPRRGGKRKGAGRKPKGARAGVKHVARPRLSGREPVHVTLRVLAGVWNLRAVRAMKLIERSLWEAGGRHGMRVTHYSVQGNHLHLIVEAQSETSLSRGMQGLQIRIAKALNKLMGRAGKVFADRFHAVVLRVPRQVRAAVNYVLRNRHKHAERHEEMRAPTGPDSCTAGFDLDGSRLGERRPIIRPRTWLLRRACALLHPS